MADTSAAAPRCTCLDSTAVLPPGEHRPGCPEAPRAAAKGVPPCPKTLSGCHWWDSRPGPDESFVMCGACGMKGRVYIASGKNDTLRAAVEEFRRAMPARGFEP